MNKPFKVFISHTLSLSDTTLAKNLYRYLVQAGWEKQEPGPAGSLWLQSSHPEVALAVPDPIKPDMDEWPGIVQRLALVEHRAATDIATSILTQFVDVARFRAANSYVI